MIPLLLVVHAGQAAEPAALPELRWRWDAPRSYRIRAQVQTLAAYDDQIHSVLVPGAVGYGIDAILTCSPDDRDKRSWDLVCRIDDIALEAVPTPEARGLLAPALPKMDALWTGSQAEVAFRDDGLIQRLDYVGPGLGGEAPWHQDVQDDIGLYGDPEQRWESASLVLYRSLLWCLERQLPDAEDGETWAQKQNLLGEPIRTESRRQDEAAGTVRVETTSKRRPSMIWGSYLFDAVNGELLEGEHHFESTQEIPLAPQPYTYRQESSCKLLTLGESPVLPESRELP